MKALIRNPGETVTENDGIEGIDWNTGEPLTNAAWCGGPYRMVQNYVPPKDGEVIVEDPEPIPQEEDVVEDDDYVTINGVRYSKAELRSLIE